MAGVELCSTCGGEGYLAVGGAPGDLLLQCLCPACLGEGFVELSVAPVSMRMVASVRAGADEDVAAAGQADASRGVSVLSRAPVFSAVELRRRREGDFDAAMLLPLWWDWGG